MDAAPADHAPNVHAVHRQRRQPAAAPMGRTDSGNTLRRQTGDEIGRDAGVVSVNMTDENVLAD